MSGTAEIQPWTAEAIPGTPWVAVLGGLLLVFATLSIGTAAVMMASPVVPGVTLGALVLVLLQVTATSFITPIAGYFLYHRRQSYRTLSDVSGPIRITSESDAIALVHSDGRLLLRTRALDMPVDTLQRWVAGLSIASGQSWEDQRPLARQRQWETDGAFRARVLFDRRQGESARNHPDVHGLPLQQCAGEVDLDGATYHVDVNEPHWPANVVQLSQDQLVCPGWEIPLAGVRDTALRVVVQPGGVVRCRLMVLVGDQIIEVLNVRPAAAGQVVWLRDRILEAVKGAERRHALAGGPEEVPDELKGLRQATRKAE